MKKESLGTAIVSFKQSVFVKVCVLAFVCTSWVGCNSGGGGGTQAPETNPVVQLVERVREYSADGMDNTLKKFQGLFTKEAAPKSKDPYKTYRYYAVPETLNITGDTATFTVEVMNDQDQATDYDWTAKKEGDEWKISSMGTFKP